MSHSSHSPTSSDQDLADPFNGSFQNVRAPSRPQNGGGGGGEAPYGYSSDLGPLLTYILPQYSEAVVNPDRQRPIIGSQMPMPPMQMMPPLAADERAPPGHLHRHHQGHSPFMVQQSQMTRYNRMPPPMMMMLDGGRPLVYPPQQPQSRQGFVRRSTAAMPNVGLGRECKFCKNNGEPMEQYKSHSLRNPSTNQLVCPVLRDHVCEECGATGDEAHTRNYCPSVKLRLRQALPIALKRTRRQSDGNVRM